MTRKKKDICPESIDYLKGCPRPPCYEAMEKTWAHFSDKEKKQWEEFKEDPKLGRFDNVVMFLEKIGHEGFDRLKTMTSTVQNKPKSPIKQLQQLLDPIVDELWDVLEIYNDYKNRGQVLPKNVQEGLTIINDTINKLMSIK